ncbi:Hint domain-containing protein [Celeribacter persicus]|uniref:Hint domain-containing protein n=1 Tax=Celeribacter persicus TaxID=1651082 RepID=A0A2T5HIA1_9RHOB|nr:Hint domain-containing protein [Celeribacter persicus]PTQ71276.1 Hint domain-containing protein [Celeribacter persicus]
MPIHKLLAYKLPLQWNQAPATGTPQPSFTYSSATMPTDTLLIDDSNGTADDTFNDEAPSSVPDPYDYGTQVVQADLFGYNVTGGVASSQAYITLTGSDGSVIKAYAITINAGRLTGSGETVTYLENIYVTTEPLVDGVTYTREPITNFIDAANGTVAYADLVACFSSGTEITTETGVMRVEELRVDDMVLTADHGYRPVRWIGSRRLGAADLALRPNLRPIHIATGALGRNLPERDLTVSPQHRMLVRSRIAERMFSSREALIAAKHLLGLPGISEADGSDGVTYWHILFDDHEVIYANGALTESLYTGPEAIKMMTPEQKAEITALFPAIVGIDPAKMQGNPRPPRRLVPGRLGRSFARRTAKTGHALIE